jgi:uncharacterized protein YcnI
MHPVPRGRLALRAATAVAATIALVLAVPLAASAHVRLYPKQAVAGADDTLITFSVPTESAKAVTSRVEIHLPTATPFADVSYQPVPGWSAHVVEGALPKPVRIEGTTVTQGPLEVVWTADPGTRLAGGQFQDFVLSVGPMPDTGHLEFPTEQTYSDGTVTRWIQPTPSSDAEPDHPAPVLYVNDAPPPDERLASDSVGLSAQAPASQATSDLGLVLSAAALLLAVVALVLGAVALLRSRRARP